VFVPVFSVLSFVGRGLCDGLITRARSSNRFKKLPVCEAAKVLSRTRAIEEEEECKCSQARGHPHLPPF
jgi:hypothetical protein